MALSLYTGKRLLVLVAHGAIDNRTAVCVAGFGSLQWNAQADASQNPSDACNENSKQERPVNHVWHDFRQDAPPKIHHPTNTNRYRTKENKVVGRGFVTENRRTEESSVPAQV
jgi:hypothetical protein